MNKKLKQSSSNSGTSGTGRFSIFESAVTPFFASVRDEVFDTQGQREKQARYAGQQPTNTQQCIQRLVEQNQNAGFHENVNMNEGGFQFGFSFAGGFNQGQDSHFSFDNNSFDNHFTFISSFHQQQSPKFFQSNVSEGNNYFSSSIAQGFANGSKPQQLQNQHQSFTQTLTNDKKSNFLEMFSFQNNDGSQNPNHLINNPPKKRSLVEQFRQEKKQNIIYEVDSKFQCQGQTNFVQNPSQSRSLSQNNKSIQQKVSQNNDNNKLSDYEALRQSIIKEISQMDSDEWEERNDDFIEVKRDINVMSDQKMSQSIVFRINEPRSQQKKNKFNESIINQLFVQSDTQNDHNNKNERIFQNNPLRTSRSMVPFRVRNNQKQQKRQQKVEQKQLIVKNDQIQRVNNQTFNNKMKKLHYVQNIYESEVQEVTNERLQMFKNSDKNVKGNQKSSYQKQDNRFSSNDTTKYHNENNLSKRNMNIFGQRVTKKVQKQQQTQKSNNVNMTKQQITQNQIDKKPQPQINQIKRKRPVFEFKPRNRINYKNQVIDERQQFQNEQKQQPVRNEFMSENLQFHSEMQTKPIDMYQSAAKQNQYGKSNNNRRGIQRSSNDLRETSKKSFHQMSVKEDNENIHKKQGITAKNENQRGPKTEIERIQKKKDQPLKERKFSIFNLKRRTTPENPAQAQKKELNTIINKNPEKQLTHIQPNNNNNRNKLELNFNKRNKQPIQQQNTLDKLQKTSQASSRQSFSSDGIKIDTKGFMDRVLNNNQGDRNHNNIQKVSYNDKQKPIINFKRLNRFSSLFGKDANTKEKHHQQQQQQQQKLKQKQRDQDQHQQHLTNHLTKTPKHEITENSYKIDKSPSFQHLKNSSKNVQMRSPNYNNNDNINDKQQKPSQKRQKMSQKQLSFKSQQTPQQSQKQLPSFHLPKYTFSKRTPPKQQLKNNSQSKSKSVTFDTVKRIQNDCDDIQDNFSFDSGIHVQQQQQIKTNSFNSRETLVKKRENNLIHGGLGNNNLNVNNRQFSSQKNSTLLQPHNQRRQLPSQSSTFSSISSRSRKSAQMMKQILQVIQQAHNVQQRLKQRKRQLDQQYRKVCFLNNLAKEKFSDQRIKKMTDWGQLEVEFQGWEIQREKEKRRKNQHKQQ